MSEETQKLHEEIVELHQEITEYWNNETWKEIVIGSKL